MTLTKLVFTSIYQLLAPVIITFPNVWLKSQLHIFFSDSFFIQLFLSLFFQLRICLISLLKTNFVYTIYSNDSLPGALSNFLASFRQCKLLGLRHKLYNLISKINLLVFVFMILYKSICLEQLEMLLNIFYHIKCILSFSDFKKITVDGGYVIRRFMILLKNIFWIDDIDANFDEAFKLIS